MLRNDPNVTPPLDVTRHKNATGGMFAKVKSFLSTTFMPKKTKGGPRFAREMSGRNVRFGQQPPFFAASSAGQTSVSAVGNAGDATISANCRALIEKLYGISQKNTTLENVKLNTDEITEALNGVNEYAIGISNGALQEVQLKELRELKNAVNAFTANRTICEGGNLYSIDEKDTNSSCIDIGVCAEATVMTLDAVRNGQTELQQNEELGFGIYSTVHRCTTASGDFVATKPCDLHKVNLFKKKCGEQSNAFFIGQLNVIGSSAGTYRRNLATHKVQELIEKAGGPRVATKISAGMIANTPCIVMEFLDGKPIAEIFRDKKNITLENELIIRETWIQILDVLTGQMDRHGYNVMYCDGKPVAIDHDMSFPRPDCKMGIINEIPTGHIAANFCMPPVIDTKMYKFIKELDFNVLENIYADCGLTRLEIDGALARARMLKDMVRKSNGRIPTANIPPIEPGEWGNVVRNGIGGVAAGVIFTKDNFYAKYHCGVM